MADDTNDKGLDTPPPVLLTPAAPVLLVPDKSLPRPVSRDGKRNSSRPGSREAKEPKQPTCPKCSAVTCLAPLGEKTHAMAGAAPARLSVQVKECGRTLDWSRLCSLLERRKDFVDVDVVSLSAAMNLFAKVVQWQRAIDLLHSSSSQELRPNERSCHACLVACDKAGGGALWSRALWLFNGMPGSTLQQNTFVQCAAVTAVARDEWQWPSELLVSWRHSSIPPTLGSCNAARGAASRAWRRVLGTTQALMQQGSVQPDIISHNSMSELFAELGDWRLSVDMAQQQHDDVTVNIALKALCEASQWPSSLTHLDASGPVRRWTQLLRSAPWRGAMKAMDAMQSFQLRSNRISHGALLAAMAAGAAWQRCLRQVMAAAGLSDVAFNAALASLRRERLWIRCLSLVEDMHCLRWAADDVTRTEVLTAAGKADAWWATLAMMEARGTINTFFGGNSYENG
ncbi:unnamed protein product [Cladocopium goreaui]|uniref:Pentacotripeptide-repeat region of PRORP domain-containing protein n=1 Tax=Cladocopium goreaui TaxID=2562237 RepID=A0A9P1DQQ1_9DINO|nr:unnamed protein product [Cladocopium goreaui]